MRAARYRNPPRPPRAPDGFEGPPASGLLRYDDGMRPALRLILVCLLALALPVKAIAGLTMPGCILAPAHAAAVHDLTAEPAPEAHDDCHGHAADAGPGPQHDPAGSDGHGHGHGHGHGSGKCSSCSPCSLVAGPAPAGPSTPALLPSHPCVSQPSAAPAGVVADVPHEPPRTASR